MQHVIFHKPSGRQEVSTKGKFAHRPKQCITKMVFFFVFRISASIVTLNYFLRNIACWFPAIVITNFLEIQKKERDDKR
jgi:hypothetical protein